jgi:hypothetical protein
MGLKERNGRPYYYENRREGRRVVSSYVGGGMAALFAQERAQKEAIKTAAARELYERKRAEINQLNSEIDRAVNCLIKTAEAELIAAGYHQHKRQWRKRRNGQTSKDHR